MLQEMLNYFISAFISCYCTRADGSSRSSFCFDQILLLCLWNRVIADDVGWPLSQCVTERLN